MRSANRFTLRWKNTRVGCFGSRVWLSSALWARYCAGTREDGSEIAANDPEWLALNQTALAAASDPASWMHLVGVYGDLGEDPHFAEPFRHQLKRIYADGIEAAIESYLEAA